MYSLIEAGRMRYTKSSLVVVAGVPAGRAHMSQPLGAALSLALSRVIGLAPHAPWGRRLRRRGRPLRPTWKHVFSDSYTACPRKRPLKCSLPRIRCPKDTSSWLAARPSPSESEPNVSYSEIGRWSVRIFFTSESVLPRLSDSEIWMCQIIARKSISGANKIIPLRFPRYLDFPSAGLAACLLFCAPLCTLAPYSATIRGHDAILRVSRVCVTKDNDSLLLLETCSRCLRSKNPA